MSDYQKKIDFAIKLLRSIPQDGEICLAYSSGKDSDVILQLARESNIPFTAIYSNTTIDPPGTIAHAKENGVKAMNPDKTFFELVRQKGVPSRFYRFCCSALKEKYLSERVILGVRRAESVRRAKRYNEPEECRVFSKTKKSRQYYPILYWEDEDVERFIQDRGIKCHPLYYDEQGNFHVERRLGCIGCPLGSMKNIRNEFMKYPKMLKLWIKNAQEYMNNHPDCKTSRKLDGNAYNQMYMRLFCNGNYANYQRLTGGGYFPRTKDRLQSLFRRLL